MNESINDILRKDYDMCVKSLKKYEKQCEKLQQENQLFKKEYDKISFHYYKTINIEIELQDRINKAIFYLENGDYGKMRFGIDLLEILKGDK